MRPSILVRLGLSSLIALVGAATFAAAKDIPVANASAFASACATAQPGDTLLLSPGEWRDAVLVFNAKGSPDAPITLAAAEPGKTKLTGRSRLTFAGPHLVARGLLFADGYIEQGAVVLFDGDQGGAVNCRLTESAIIAYNASDRTKRYNWVQLSGNGHRVDHCRFEGGDHFGITIQIVAGAGDNRHRIDRNYFLNRAPGGDNGYETIQVGQARDAHRDSNSVVEYNLFESCDGEQEIVSNKTGGNVYRKNTFIACAGALTLRHGDRALVEANIFLGAGKLHTGGVRVIGRDHVVRGNYFHGLTGLPTAGAVIALYAGIPNSIPTGYVESENAIIADNVLIDNAANGINLSAGHLSRNRTILPRNVSLRDNWIDQHPLYGATVLTGTPAEGLACIGNFYTAHSEIGYAPPGGFTQTPFQNPANPDLPFPTYDAMSPPDTREHNGWKTTMAGLELLAPGKVGPSWWRH
jgi:poly(beta-D-mannuronate) lyase